MKQLHYMLIITIMAYLNIDSIQTIVSLVTNVSIEYEATFMKQFINLQMKKVILVMVKIVHCSMMLTLLYLPSSTPSVS